MKKCFTLLTVGMLLFTTLRSNAQNNSGNDNGSGFDQLIKSNAADATKLIQHFAEPLFKGFGIGLNSGWNNTAKTKKFLHFDLRISANAAQVPVSDQSFDVTQIGLTNVKPAANSPTNIAPTFGGSKNAPTPIMEIFDNNGKSTGATFNMPNGVIKYIPAPDIQLTVGVGKNTDLTIRTIPAINIGSNSGSIKMIGFGIKHDIIQDFAGKGKIKPFDLAIAVNYNKITYSKSLTVQPDANTAPAPGEPTNPDFSTQRVSGSFSGINVQGIISKKLLFFTPFLAVAYQSASTDFGILGNYPVTTSAGFYSVIPNPVHINETSVSGFRTDIGFQLNLLVMRIFASYSPGQYQSANAGIGFGF